jgi:FixJ family two-component response regulator
MASDRQLMADLAAANMALLSQLTQKDAKIAKLLVQLQANRSLTNTGCNSN